MAAPNEPTPDSPQSDHSAGAEGETTASAGYKPDLPEVSPVISDSAASGPEAPTDAEVSTAPETPAATSEDIASSQDAEPEVEPVIESEPEVSADTSPSSKPDDEAVAETATAAALGDAERPEPALSDPEPPEPDMENEPAESVVAAAASAPPPAKAEPATATPPPSPAATPTASGSTVQRIWGLLKPALKTGLATGIKGANWLAQQLEAVSPTVESSATGPLGALVGLWKVVKPLLVALTLSLSRIFSQVLQWSLARLDPEAKAAAAAESSRVAFLITSATLAVLVFLTGNLLTASPAPAAARAPSGEVSKPAPNQALLEAIQARIDTATDDYDGTVYAVDLDVAGDRLLVTLDDGWYRLTERQQQRLARKLQQRAEDSQLSQLTLINERGERIARTPVVGKGMIFFETIAPPPPPAIPDSLASPAEPPATAEEDVLPDTTEGEPILGDRPISSADSASPVAAAPDPSSPTPPGPPE